jgi:ATP-independent RNA helicase DbpA
MEASGTAVLMLAPNETIPAFIHPEPTEIELSTNAPLPSKPEWTTLYLSLGRKDKVNKIDIVGFLTNKGRLKKDDIGLIEVKDFASFVAVRKSHAGDALQRIKEERIKNKKVKIDVAK